MNTTDQDPTSTMSVNDAETVHVDHVQVERAVLPLDSFKSSRELVQPIRVAMAGKSFLVCVHHIRLITLASCYRCL